MIRKIIFWILYLFFTPHSSGQDIQYFYDDISFAQVKKLPEHRWTPLQGSLYEGHKNGTYWFRISNIQEPNSFISIPENHLSETLLFKSDGIQIKNIPKTRVTSFFLNTSSSGEIYYLKVLLEKKAVVSIEVQSFEEYTLNKARENSFLGIYYGIVIVVILINLIAYINYKRNTYLHYVIMLSSITLGLLAADGYIQMLFDSKIIHKYAEPFFNLCVSLSLPILANSYMPLKKYIPQINYIGLALGLITMMLFMSYVASGDFHMFALTEITALALVTTYWIGGFLIFKKSLEAKVFCIAYFIICFSCYDFYIARSFSFDFIGLTLDQFRVGAIVEMLVFTYAIGHQGKLLRIENEKMRNKLIRYSQGKEGQLLLSSSNNFKLVEQYSLSKKEIQVLQKISEGKVDKDIAKELHHSLNTIKFFIKNIYTKLEVSSRQEVKRKYFSTVHL